MTIRKKIFLLAGILLALFGAVVGVLAIVQKLDSDQISNIAEYELPLTRLVAELDVDTDRYELGILRALRLDPLNPPELAAAIAAKKEVGDELRADADTATALIAKAIKDRGYGASERVELARIEGAFKYLIRSLEGFLATGEQVMAALVDGRREDARTASLGFAKYARAFGPDLSEVRLNLADLTDRGTRDVLARQRLNTYLSFGLFLLACSIGLGVSAVGSARVVGGLRQLVVRTRAIEAGAVSEPLSILTRDEVGELALSFNRMVEELRTRERIKDTFGKFVDPRIVSRLIGSGAEQAERRTLTIFFSDIKDFSGISEQLTASAVVNLLNSYFGTVAEVIHAHRGFIDKYIGDAVMAFWVSPFSAGDDHASDACLAALAQQEAVIQLRAQLPEITGMRRNPPELAIRMGIATGEAVVGTIGSDSSRSYTVIGDTVNLASRLESINKLYGTSLILSEETYRTAQHVIEARELDLITVAGKTEPVRIYEAMGRAGEIAPEQIQLREMYANGLAAYRRQDWNEAQRCFESCQLGDAQDGPSRLFIERISLLRSSPPPADWDGVWHFKEK
ncbi:adenylate/guanylate cyclase domain-containing protein [Bradyrhizobium lablabi]|uniref:Adenylate cyclase n=2 Tax=Bradyrhizobium TaxID=374 RepID=A0ABY0P586_9BRAD|nr:adenylate/guanylate cyclase domain-containing protein [Bradyrhizobium lablabi]SDH38496.1 adenylate cyclase [Bradyrhizobium ottawaense]SEE35337.1 adenylate cyclase [Bradyrhizobium lablabi]